MTHWNTWLQKILRSLVARHRGNSGLVNAKSEIAANNHQVVLVGDGGVEVTKVMRDSVDMPRLSKSTSAPALVVLTPPTLVKDVGTAMVKAWVAPPPKVEANRQQREPVTKPCPDVYQKLVSFLLCAKATCVPNSGWPG